MPSWDETYAVYLQGIYRFPIKKIEYRYGLGTDKVLRKRTKNCSGVPNLRRQYAESGHRGCGGQLNNMQYPIPSSLVLPIAPPGTSAWGWAPAHPDCYWGLFRNRQKELRRQWRKKVKGKRTSPGKAENGRRDFHDEIGNSWPGSGVSGCLCREGKLF